MKQADIIRLAIIAVAILFGYYAIITLIDFISSIPGQYSAGDGKIPLSMILRAGCFSLASWLLIRYSRKISGFIEQQK